MGRAPLFPKPGEPLFSRAGGEARRQHGEQNSAPDARLARTPPRLQPASLRLHGLRATLPLSHALGKQERPPQPSPPRAVSPPPDPFPEMLGVIPKAEPAFLGSPWGWAPPEPAQGEAVRGFTWRDHKNQEL